VRGIGDDRLRIVARALGINHVAIEVGEIDQALEWYARLVDFELRGRVGDAMAFIDMGDQFIAIVAGRSQAADGARHFGLVVDDMEDFRAALQREGVSVSPSGSVDFTDPWGNHVQVVDYRDIQFEKTPAVLRGMGAGAIEKSPAALAELRAKGLAG
jgi:catechol-2,3-dioxygenase